MRENSLKARLHWPSRHRCESNTRVLILESIEGSFDAGEVIGLDTVSGEGFAAYVETVDMDSFAQRDHSAELEKVHGIMRQRELGHLATAMQNRIMRLGETANNEVQSS